MHPSLHFMHEQQHTLLEQPNRALVWQESAWAFNQQFNFKVEPTDFAVGKVQAIAGTSPSETVKVVSFCRMWTSRFPQKHVVEGSKVSICNQLPFSLPYLQLNPGTGSTPATYPHGALDHIVGVVHSVYIYIYAYATHTLYISTHVHLSILTYLHLISTSTSVLFDHTTCQQAPRGPRYLSSVWGCCIHCPGQQDLVQDVSGKIILGIFMGISQILMIWGFPYLGGPQNGWLIRKNHR